MLLLGTFGVGTGSMHLLMLGCLILLHAPILAPHCQGATKFMNRRNVEHMMNRFGRWRELVFPISCCSHWRHGTYRTATIVFRKLASMLAEKWNANYSCCLFWVQCRFCFSLLRSAVMCLRGHRSSTSHLITSMIDLAYSEGHLESGTLN